MTNPQRFSGRELGLLLSQVRDELGEDATIIEANRLREGGIGGFFSKERFEVVATPGDGPGDERDRSPVTAATGAEARTAGHDHLGDLLSRADRVSADERASTRATGRPGTAGASDDARFEEILRTTLTDLSHLTDSSATERFGPAIELDASSQAGAQAIVTTPAVVEPSPPGPAPAPPKPAPPSAAAAPPPPPPPPPPAPARHAATAPAAVAPPAATALRPDLEALPGGRFWSRLVRFEQLVDESPLAATITTVVGPVDDALAVARQLARQAGVDLGDLVVVSDRARVDGIPPWQLVDGRDGLAERVRYWRATGARALVVVDLEPGDRGLERAARLVAAAGGDLTRLVVRRVDDPAGLASTLRGLGPVGAIDVSRPPDPDALVALVEQGVRVGTVCGRALTALLLAGLAGADDRG